MTELGRRLAHVSGTVVPLVYLFGPMTWEQLQVLVGAGAVLAVGLEVVRLWVGLDWWVYDRLTREYESDAPAGYALAVVSAAVVVWVFEPPVALAATLMLTIADPISGVLGSAGVGERKSLGVMAVTVGVCLVIGLAFLPPRAAVPAAVVATLVDSYTPVVAGFVIDDNASIPLGAALVAGLALSVVPVLCTSCPAPPIVPP